MLPAADLLPDTSLAAMGPRRSIHQGAAHTRSDPYPTHCNEEEPQDALPMALDSHSLRRTSCKCATHLSERVDGWRSD